MLPKRSLKKPKSWFKLFLLAPVFILISGGALFAFLNKDLFLPQEKTKERKVMAVLKADHFYLLDEEAYVLGVAEDNGGLPVLHSDWSSLGLKKGDSFPQEEIKKALVLIRELGLLELKVKEAIWQDQDLEVVLSGVPTKTFFSLEKDLIFQVNSLQVILKRAKIEGKVFEKIDLRFGKPVITL